MPRIVEEPLHPRPYARLRETRIRSAAGRTQSRPMIPLAAVALAVYTVVVSPTLQAHAGRHARGVVACPAGTVPLGGGVGVHPVGTGAHVNGSFPSSNGWVADVSAGLAGV